MQLPPNDSKIWNFLILLTVGTLFTLNANTLYQNGWSNADLINLIVQLSGVGGMMALRAYGSAK